MDVCVGVCCVEVSLYVLVVNLSSQIDSTFHLIV